MDKSKIGAILALVALVGFLALSKHSEAPAPPGDPDDDEAQPAATTKPDPKAAATQAALVGGGVKELKIEDEQVGTGKAAAPGDTLTMDYKGTLLDGTIFDQSYGKSPFTFTLGSGQVIKGWDKGIVGMKVGGKRKLTIPSDLGYGAGGSPPKIPGGATLLFDVELKDVKKKGG